MLHMHTHPEGRRTQAKPLQYILPHTHNIQTHTHRGECKESVPQVYVCVYVCVCVCVCVYVCVCVCACVSIFGGCHMRVSKVKHTSGGCALLLITHNPASSPPKPLHQVKSPESF